MLNSSKIVQFNGTQALKSKNQTIENQFTTQHFRFQVQYFILYEKFLYLFICKIMKLRPKKTLKKRKKH